MSFEKWLGVAIAAVIGVTILLCIWLLVGYKAGVVVDEGQGSALRYWHDDAHGVSCWTAYSSSISCLPDSEVRLP
jgi:hypothetical protein